MNEKEKDRISGLFLYLRFSTYRIFSGKAKKFRLVIGIFEKKYFFQDMSGKRASGANPCVPLRWQGNWIRREPMGD